MRALAALALLVTLGAAACATPARNRLTTLAPENVVSITATDMSFQHGPVAYKEDGEHGEDGVVITGLSEGGGLAIRCTLEGETASALVSALAHANTLPSPPQHTAYGYDLRVSLNDGSQISAILPMTLNAGQSAAIFVDQRMLLLDKPYFVHALELIEAAGC